MLKILPKNLSPEWLKILCEMGHGDEIVIGDGNFPAASHAQRLIRSDASGVAELLESILEILPLDTYVESAVSLMKTGSEYVGEPEVWSVYRKTLEKHEEFKDFEFVERFEFYERAKKAYAIIATSEEAIYANVILKKGIIK